jgi:phosphatidyl-myo-inositol dimannoside synthase
LVTRGSLLLLVPQAYGSEGGVPAYSRRLAEILSDYAHRKDYDLDCISLNDSDYAKERHSHPVTYRSFIGSGRSKLHTIRSAVQLAFTRCPLVTVVGHVHLSPVAWGLKKMGLLKSYIVVLHGTEAWEEKDWLQRVAVRKAASVVATTSYTASVFCKHNRLRHDQTCIIPLAVSESDVPEPSWKRQNCTELKVLTVGRLTAIERYKGVDTLIEAVEALQKKGVIIKLTVVGKGDDVPRLQEKASRLGLNGRVEFLGEVPDNRLHQAYQDCDLFAMPSKGEGFGIVFLEAMRYGKPCIGGDHGGTPEVIDHGIDGYLVKHGDVDGLVRYLVEFYQNPKLLEDLGLRAYQSLKSKYLFPHMQNNWFRLLDRVLDNG